MIFDIGDIFYRGAAASHVDKLRILQNRAVRLIYKLPARENTDRLLVNLKLLPLKKRRLKDIGSKLLKDALCHPLEELIYIFNLSILTGQFLKALKVANAVLILKVTNSNTADELRPVSFLPVPGN